MQGLRRAGLFQLAIWARTFGFKAYSQQILETAAKEFPDDPRIVEALGYAYAQQGRNREALALYDRAALRDTDNVELEFNRAFLTQALNDHEGAIARFRRVLEMNPDHDRALYGLALSLISLRRLDEAVPPLERNTRLQPMSPYGWYQLGRVQFDRGNVERTDAIIAKLNTFEPKVAAQLARDTGRPAPPRP